MQAICLFVLAAIAITAVESTEQQPYVEIIAEESQTRLKRASSNKDFNIQVVKKPGRIRQIHLYPYSHKKDDAASQPLLSDDIYKQAEEQDAADSTNVEKVVGTNALQSKDVLGSDSTNHYIKEQKDKIKIKHHHHHHHHNHVKTVVKKQPYPVEKIIHVPKPYPVEKMVEKVIHVPVHKIVEIPKPYPVEKVVEKLVHVPKPYPVKELVEKRVPYPVEKVVEKIVHVPKFLVKHIPVEIKVPVPIEKPVPYPVEKKIPYPVEIKVPYEVEKKVPYPVKIYVPHPVPVEKPSHHHHHDYPSHHHSHPLSYTNHHDYDHHFAKSDQSQTIAHSDRNEQIPQAQTLRASILPKKTISLAQQQHIILQQQLQRQQQEQHQAQIKLLQQQKDDQQRLYQQYQQKLQFNPEDASVSTNHVNHHVHNVEHEGSSSDFHPIINTINQGSVAAASNNVQSAVAPPQSLIGGGNFQISQFKISIPDQLPQPDALVMEPTNNPGSIQYQPNTENHYYHMQAALETPKGFTLNS